MGPMEIYDGVRFETERVLPRPPRVPEAAGLVSWCLRFVETGLASAGADASGNLSVRLERGFLVTPTHVPMDQIGEDDLVHVLEADETRNRVRAAGSREPSSESLLHAALYAARPEVRAVFHGHHERVLAQGREAGLPSTPREAPYGTPEIAALAVEVARGADVFLLRGHGFVAVGPTMDLAGARALDALRRVEGLRRR